MLRNLIGPAACGVSVALAMALSGDPNSGPTLAILTCLGYTIGILTTYDKDCDCE